MAPIAKRSYAQALKGKENSPPVVRRTYAQVVGVRRSPLPTTRPNTPKQQHPAPTNIEMTQGMLAMMEEEAGWWNGSYKCGGLGGSPEKKTKGDGWEPPTPEVTPPSLQHPAAQ